MKRKATEADPDMLPEYDFSHGVRGKYAARYAQGTNVVLIEPDVAPYFPTPDAVNAALRSLVAIIEQHDRQAATLATVTRPARARRRSKAGSP